MEEAAREAAAAEYELNAAQEQLRMWEDAILKAQGEVNRSTGLVSQLQERKLSQNAQLESLKQRSVRILQEKQLHP